jgi:hypothetical protein
MGLLIQVPSTSSEKSFNESNDWLDRAIAISANASYISSHYCCFYRESVLLVLEKNSIPVCSSISATIYAAMISELRTTHEHKKVLTRHLRYLIGQCFCPSRRHFEILYNGHSEINVGSLSWDYNGTQKAKTVEWCQTDIIMEVENQMSRVLQSHNVEPSTSKGIQVVVGGDHGDTAFQFGAEVAIMLSDKRVIDFEITNIELICRTDTASLIKATILPN